MYPPINARFHPSRQLLRPTCRIFFLPCHLQNALYHESAPYFIHRNRPDTWIFVQYNQSSTHQRLLGGPRGSTICEPLHEVRHRQPQTSACCPEYQDTVLQDY